MLADRLRIVALQLLAVNLPSYWLLGVAVSVAFMFRSWKHAGVPLLTNTWAAPRRMRLCIEARLNTTDGRALLERRGYEAAVIPESPLADVLGDVPDWRQVHRDDRGLCSFQRATIPEPATTSR